MGLFGKQSLQRNTGQINRADINEQDKNVIGGKNISSWKKRPCLVVQKMDCGDHIDHRLK